MLTQTGVSPTSGTTVTNTWEVWDVTREDEDYLVEDGLTEGEAKEMARQFTNDPEKTHYDEEKGVELDAEFEARNGFNQTQEPTSKIAETEFDPKQGPLSKDF